MNQIWHYIFPKNRAFDILHGHGAAKFRRNLIKYMSIQHIWNLSWLLGLFNCRDFKSERIQNYQA